MGYMLHGGGKEEPLSLPGHTGIYQQGRTGRYTGRGMDKDRGSTVFTARTAGNVRQAEAASGSFRTGRNIPVCAAVSGWGGI